MSEDSTLTLEKFGSIGGDYFEHLVAVALDELGYTEGKTYLASWAKKCVPGTWIEADFIISKKSDASHDPLNNGRIVLAIGHATSENSAGMKFHRDVEQLLEVKSLQNGDDYRVMDILFCCPRETMGGWSKELVAINEAIFDNSLIVWKHDWGMRLLQQIQLHGEKLTQGGNKEKKRKLLSLLDKHPAFRRQFNAFRDQLQTMLSDAKSHSKIQDIFKEERKQLPKRLSMPLLTTEPEKTDFKRGLLQVLALNPWEVELLHRNHQENRDGKVYPLEKLALAGGMSQLDFENWWKRLELLSFKLGKCSSDFIGDEMLLVDSKEWRFFGAGKELAFVLANFPADALLEMTNNIKKTSENLFAYVIETRDMSRVDTVITFIINVLKSNSKDVFYEALCEHFERRQFLGLARERLTLLEVSMAVICTKDKRFSYDKLSKKSKNIELISNSNQFRRYPKLQGNPRNKKFHDASEALWKTLKKVTYKWIEESRDEIKKTFFNRTLDGMIKQPRAGEGALDVILKESIYSFAKRTSSSLVITQDFHGEISAFNRFLEKSAAGINVEIPYVLTLPDERKILIHRVMADGGVGHKRKEFASKIRSIRYESHANGFRLREDIFATLIVLDGNWVTPDLEDKLTPFRMLTVAGWDYVVYPDQLNAAFSKIEASLQSTTKKVARA
jgi:hypothetical protein